MQKYSISYLYEIWKCLKRVKYMCNGFWLAVTMYDATMNHKQCAICCFIIFIIEKVLTIPRILTHCRTRWWTWSSEYFPMYTFKTYHFISQLYFSKDVIIFSPNKNRIITLENLLSFILCSYIFYSFFSKSFYLWLVLFSSFI